MTEPIKKWWQELHIGSGHAQGMLRLGAKELAARIVPAFPAQQGIIEEPGIFGNLTPGEIAKQKEGELSLDHDQEPKHEQTLVEQLRSQAAQRQEQATPPTPQHEQNRGNGH